MKIKILGPLYCGTESCNATPTARQLRKVFALLLLNYSRTVPISALVEELWDGAQPKTALATLRTYVLQLRKSLASVTGMSPSQVSENVLCTTTNGYVLHTTSSEFDLAEYRACELDASRAMERGDLMSAASLLHYALGLWQGPVLADVEPGALLASEIAGIEQSRLTMLDHRIELDMRLGRHRDLLGELTTLSGRYPLYEDLHAQLMLALLRSGHRRQALDVFHRLRQRLVDSLGLEPSPRVQQVFQQLLSGDQEIDQISVVPLPRSAETPRMPVLTGHF